MFKYPLGEGIPDPPLPFTGGRIAASEEERTFVRRRVMLQFFVAPALSFAVMLIGFNLGWPRLTAAGVIALGFSALLTGYLAISEKRMMFIRGGSMTRREYRYFIYEGFAAVPYGLVSLVVGACLITPAALFLNGMSLERIRDMVLTRPGLALIPLGVLFGCQGLGFLIGFGRRATSVGDRLWIEFQHLPARLGGLILIVWGAGFLVIGFVEWFTPALFNHWFQAIFGNPWPYQPH